MELTRPSKSAANLEKLKLSVQVRAGNTTSMTPSKFLLKKKMRMETKANSFDAWAKYQVGSMILNCFCI